jgi:nucleoside-diphosphate kinase
MAASMAGEFSSIKRLIRHGQKELLKAERAFRPVRHERTLTIIKPDAVEMHLTGEIISRLEKQGIKPIAMKMVRLNRLQAAIFYRHLKGKLPDSVFSSTIEYMTSNRAILIVWQGNGVVKKVRKAVGPTDPQKAGKRQIRSLSQDDLKHQLRYGKAVRNIIHASASPKEAEQEIRLFFLPWELNG